MRSFVRYLVPFLALPAMASAQDGLGLRTARLDIETSDSSSSAQGQVDIRFTRYHGLQGDVGITQFDAATIGFLAGHLYLSTNDKQKYGLFASYHDWDDASISAYTIGVEGMFDFSDSTAFDFQAGLGALDPAETDFIFAEFGITHRLTPEIHLNASASMIEVEEADFKTVAQTVEISSEYHLSDLSSVTAGLRHSWISGDLADDKTEAFVGLAINFGRNGSPSISTPFKTPQPLRPYWRRGITLP